MDTNIKTAIDVLYSTLIKRGYRKEAAELQAIENTQTQNPTQTTDTGGKFQEERPPQRQDLKPQSIFRGQPGSAAPILELNRIIDEIENTTYFKNLPEKVIHGIFKIKKMTRDAFKFASEKEALFGKEKDTVKLLQEYLFKFDKNSPTPRNIPEDIKRALNNLNALVSQHVARLPVEKTVLERGQDFARGLAEKGKGIVRDVSEKGREIVRDVSEKGRQFKEDLDEKRQLREDEKTNRAMKRFEDTQAIKNNEYLALSKLKLNLSDQKSYKKIFYRLPAQIIKILEDIGLGLDDLTNLSVARVACHVNNTLLYYLKSKKAYSSKAAMDFSNIGNVITPNSTLDERELTRVIRLAIAAELDAVHLYELIVDSSDDETVKKVLQSISDEEKVHASELTELLNMFDKENKKFVEDGKKEVVELTKK